MYLNPRIIALYDDYTHAPLPRRALRARLARPETGHLGYGGMRCYVARPKNTAGKLPTVVMIHENRDLNVPRTIAFLKDALR